MTSPSAPALQANQPEFLDLFPTGAVPEPLGSGFVWTEGPCYVPSRQAVIFSDVRTNKTWRYTDAGALDVEMNPSHHQNGHCLDAQGRLIACSHGLRALLRQGEDGLWTILADSYQGKRLNSPNDVALHPDGSLWFSDPSYGIDKPEEGYGGTMEQQGRYVYRLDADGTLSAPIQDRVKPNGLAFASATQLLLADTGEGKVHSYHISPTGEATYDRLWFTVNPGKTDGLRLDEAGRIWSSAGDGVHVLTPDGQTELGRIVLPEICANLCWGGPGSTTLYMTASTHFWRIPTRVRGLTLAS